MGCQVVTLPVTKIDASNWVFGEDLSSQITGCNLEFVTANVFQPETLQVFVDGKMLLKNSDYEIYSNNKGFRILLNSEDQNRLNKPPQHDEEITVNYMLAIHFNCQAINL